MEREWGYTGVSVHGTSDDKNIEFGSREPPEEPKEVAPKAAHRSWQQASQAAQTHLPGGCLRQRGESHPHYKYLRKIDSGYDPRV